jgi:hypothetical protein
MSKKKDRKFSDLLLIFLYVATFSALIYYFWRGFSYYLTPYLERPHHSAHQTIKPGGLIGHGLGIVGSLMMILMLLYSVRKRYRILKKWGSINIWLNYHIYLGITGPLFVVLHSSFKLNGIVAISFWSMVAVALSGVLGRYLYIQIPRTISGNELNLKELDEIYQKTSREVFANYRIDETYLAKIENMIIGRIDAAKGSLRVLMTLALSDLFLPLRMRRARKRIRRLTGVSKKNTRILVTHIKKKAILHRQIALWQHINNLFHYWHVIHKPFAVVMYLIMIIHVIITVLLGYKWLF